VTARQWNVASPAAYVAANREGRPAVAGSEWLDLATTAADLVMMGLRLDQGLDLEVTDYRVPGFARTIAPVATRLAADGLLEQRRGRLRATARGRAVLNPVVAEFLPA